MTIDEQIVLMGVPGSEMLGVLARPASTVQTKRIGVVIVVGGPQTRVGSHRQFVLLARALARAGFACLRFDYSGMGDSPGRKPSFERAGPDIRQACDALLEAVPSCDRVALWGLCDGASAALMYSKDDARVTLVIAANPWVRSEQTWSAAIVSGHYAARIRSTGFWLRLLSGKVDVSHSLREAAGHLWRAWQPSRSTESKGPPQSVRGLLGVRIPSTVEVVFMLSGNDLVAREFELASKEWLATLTGRFSVIRHDSADHTFSGPSAMERVSGDVLHCLGAHLDKGSE